MPSINDDAETSERADFAHQLRVDAQEIRAAGAYLARLTPLGVGDADTDLLGDALAIGYALTDSLAARCDDASTQLGNP